MASQGKMKRQHRSAIIADFIDQDTIPSFVVSTDGLVEFTNRAWQSIFAPSGGETLTRMLSKTFYLSGQVDVEPRADSGIQHRIKLCL